MANAEAICKMKASKYKRVGLFSEKYGSMKNVMH